MKKNKMMRIASVLLVAVLLSTSVISGTFAKYTTTGTGTDSAKVAKWGVTIEANGSTFAKSYTADDTSASTVTNSVVTTGEDNIVAPGTKGDMTAMTISGTPEVAVKVSYEATVELSGWVGNASNAYYCPLVIKVGETEFKGIEYQDADAFATAIKNAIEGYTAVYQANQDLSDTNTVKTPSVSWSWAFETTKNDATCDAQDTYLGDQAAKGNAASISISIKTTVTQVD